MAKKWPSPDEFNNMSSEVLKAAADTARDVLLGKSPSEELYESLAEVYGAWPPPQGDA